MRKGAIFFGCVDGGRMPSDLPRQYKIYRIILESSFAKSIIILYKP